MKMDAVPGIPTTMWFTPKYTTRQMREKYGPDFNYEISCQEMCGPGHFSMRGIVVVESEAEYKIWLASKKPQYVAAQAFANGGGNTTTPPTTPAQADTTKAAGATSTSMR
jgi:cytochrome c oxidase subunit 2